MMKKSLAQEMSELRQRLLETEVNESKLFKYGPNNQPGRISYGGRTYIYRHPLGDLVGTYGDMDEDFSVELAFVYIPNKNDSAQWLKRDYPVNKSNKQRTIDLMKIDGEEIANLIAPKTQIEEIIKILVEHKFTQHS